MKSYVRKSRKLGKGEYLITRYTVGESLFINIIKLFFYICFLWPIEIVIWIILAPFKFIIWLFKRKK